jgi:hypothetical protein
MWKHYFKNKSSCNATLAKNPSLIAETQKKNKPNLPPEDPTDSDHDDEDDSSSANSEP